MLCNCFPTIPLYRQRWFVLFLRTELDHKCFRLIRVRQVDWMEFREIVTFMEVAQLKSFSRAAEKLGYSQAAVVV